MQIACQFYKQNTLNLRISYHGRFLTVYNVKIKLFFPTKNYLLITEKLEETKNRQNWRHIYYRVAGEGLTDKDIHE